jgi:hypothetical protein
MFELTFINNGKFFSLCCPSWKAVNEVSNLLPDNCSPRIWLCDKGKRHLI